MKVAPAPALYAACTTCTRTYTRTSRISTDARRLNLPPSPAPQAPGKASDALGKIIGIFMNRACERSAVVTLVSCERFVLKFFDFEFDVSVVVLYYGIALRNCLSNI